MAQAMERSKVIELLEYYKDIDGEVSIYRKIINDLTDQYYNPIGAIQCDGLPKGKNNISQMRLGSVFKMRTSILNTATTEQMG